MALNDIVMIGGREYTDLTPVMTSNTEPSPYRVDATSSNGSKQFYAFDDNINTSYRSQINFINGTIQMDFGKEVVCDFYTLMSGHYDVLWTMKTWTFEGSKDGSKWDVLHSVTDMTNWITTTTVHEFSFENSTPYRYYRINCTAKNGSNSICIGEWKFYKKSNPTMTFHKTLESNIPVKVTNGNDEIHFTEKGNIYISKTDGSMMKIIGSESGGSSESGGISIRSLKLDVTVNGQKEFETGIIPSVPLDELEFYFVVNGNMYIDGVSSKLDSSGNVVVSFVNTNFELETTDEVFLLYSKECVIDSVSGDMCISNREW